MHLTTETPPASRWRPHVAVLALAAFAVGTDIFVVAGVLPAIADSFGVGIGTAGQMVTVFALAYAVSAPITGSLAAGWSRRSALVTALLVFAAGNAMTALASTFALVLASRCIAAAGAGLFTATASATAASLAGPERRGRALAAIVLAFSTSLAFGAPLGTAIGNAWNWRMTLWAVAALGLLAAAVILWRLPHVREGAPAGLRKRLEPLALPGIREGLLSSLVVFTGVFIHYTYVSVVYAPLAAGHAEFLAFALFVFGVGGCAGSSLSGRLVDRVGAHRVLAGICLGLTVVFLVIPWVRDQALPALAMIGLSGLLSFALPPALQHELLAQAPSGTRSVVTALYQSSLYFAISLAAALGSFALHRLEPRYLTVLAAGFVALAPLLRGRARSPALAPCRDATRH